MREKSAATFNRVTRVPRDFLAATRRATLSSSLADLQGDWRTLDVKIRRRLETLLFRTPIVLAGLSLIMLLVMASNIGGTVVHVVARTEYVRYTPLGSDPPQWYLQDATFSFAPRDRNLSTSAFFPDATPSDDSADPSHTALSHSDPSRADRSSADPPNAEESSGVDISPGVDGDDGDGDGDGDGDSDTRFTGFFQPQCGDTIIVNRIGTGLLDVIVHSSRPPLITDIPGTLASFLDEPVASNFRFSMPLTSEDGADTASSITWPVEGRVDPGRAVGPQATADKGLLLEGKVHILAGRVLSRSTYQVEEQALELGDHVKLPTAVELDEIIADIQAEQQQTRTDANTPAANLASQTADNPIALQPEKDGQHLCLEYDSSGTTGITDKGFIHPRGGRSLGVMVSLSNNASHVEISRYRSQSIKLSNSWIKRILNDKFIALCWAIIGALFVFHRKLVRLAVIIASDRDPSSSLASDTKAEDSGS